MSNLEMAYSAAKKQADNDDSFIVSVRLSKDEKTYWFSVKGNRYADSNSGDPSVACKSYRYDILNGELGILEIWDMLDAELSEEEIDLSTLKRAS